MKAEGSMQRSYGRAVGKHNVLSPYETFRLYLDKYLHFYIGIEKNCPVHACVYAHQVDERASG
jgi:hypothetical protein